MARQSSSHSWEHAFRADPTSGNKKKHVKTQREHTLTARYAGKTHRKKRAWCSRAGKTHFSKKMKKKNGSGTLLLARRVFSLGMSWRGRPRPTSGNMHFVRTLRAGNKKKHVKTHVNTRTDARYAGETHRKKRAWCSRAGKTHFSKKLKKNGSGTCLLANAFPIRSQGVPKAFPGASQPEGQQASAQAPEQVKRSILQEIPPGNALGTNWERLGNALGTNWERIGNELGTP